MASYEVASTIHQYHVMLHIVDPRFLSSMASYDVVSTMHQFHVATLVMNPDFLSEMISYDVASIVQQPLWEGGERARQEGGAEKGTQVGTLRGALGRA
jgi:hypothetical protein